MPRLAGLARERLQHRRRDREQRVLLERAGGQREEAGADPVALRIGHLGEVAELHHRLREVEGGAVVQPDRFAELGEVDALAVARHLLEDRERALEGLDAAALLRRLGGHRDGYHFLSRRHRASYSSSAGVVTTMNVRSVIPSLRIECDTPGGMKITSCRRTICRRPAISIEPSPSSTW
jgi:hypothetical protein